MKTGIEEGPLIPFQFGKATEAPRKNEKKELASKAMPLSFSLQG